MQAFSGVFFGFFWSFICFVLNRVGGKLSDNSKALKLKGSRYLFPVDICQVNFRKCYR